MEASVIRLKNLGRGFGVDSLRGGGSERGVWSLGAGFLVLVRAQDSRVLLTNLILRESDSKTVTRLHGVWGLGGHSWRECEGW